MRFEDLDREAGYLLRVVYLYFPGQPRYEGRLTANDEIEIHPAGIRADEDPGPQEFALPRRATRDGTLLLTWSHDPAAGGTPVSELWLIRTAGAAVSET
jgi:hypothetical protein